MESRDGKYGGRRVSRRLRLGLASKRMQTFQWAKVWSDFCLIAVLFYVNRAGLVGNAIAYVCLCLLVWKSPFHTLKALTISGLILIANPALISSSAAVGLGKFVLVGVAAVKCWTATHSVRRDPLSQNYQKALLAFCLIAAALTPVNDYYVAVSLLKVCIFLLGATTLLGLSELKLAKTGELLAWLISLFIFILASSLLTIPLGISRVVRARVTAGDSFGLSGLTNQPQALGGVLAVLAVASFSLFAFSKQRQRVYFLGLFLALLPLLFMTQSRTAVFAVLGALAVAVLISPAVVSRARRVFRSVTMSRLIGILLPICGLVFLAGLFGVGGLEESVKSFLVKNRREISEGVDFDALAWDRMRLIENSWEAFLESPITGINFGTSKDSYFIENASLLGAPTEKGLIVTAVLEEVGLVGASAFLVFVWLLIRSLWQRGNIVGLCGLITMLILNFGEMSFFSFGGVGLFLWSIVILSIVLGNSLRSDIIIEKRRKESFLGFKAGSKS